MEIATMNQIAVANCDTRKANIIHIYPPYSGNDLYYHEVSDNYYTLITLHINNNLLDSYSSQRKPRQY